MRQVSRFICMLVLLGGSPSAVTAVEPNPDCAAAKPGSIERLLRGSRLLSRLDAELTRIYALATAPKSAAAAATIRTQQAAWLAGRSACIKSPTQTECTRDLYLARIATIRAQSRPARSDDNKGISLGPFAFRCDQLDATLDITYVNVDPGLAWVTVEDHAYPLVQQRSGSGARYEGNGTLFWEHQGDARWRGTTSTPEVACSRVATKPGTG